MIDLPAPMANLPGNVKSLRNPWLGAQVAAIFNLCPYKLGGWNGIKDTFMKTICIAIHSP